MIRNKHNRFLLIYRIMKIFPLCFLAQCSILELIHRNNYRMDHNAIIVKFYSLLWITFSLVIYIVIFEWIALTFLLICSHQSLLLKICFLELSDSWNQIWLLYICICSRQHHGNFVHWSSLSRTNNHLMGLDEWMWL